jgi:serine/threonine-protein kinase RsbW
MSAREGQSEEIRLSLPSQLEVLSIIDKVVDGIAEQMSFEDDDKDAIAISVIEAGTNAIQHGHAHDPSLSVEIIFRMKENELEVDVLDHGHGFNLNLLEDATAPENLLKARGRGIFIMRSMMDDVVYSFSDRGTTCRMVKKKRNSTEPDVVEHAPAGDA